MKNYIKHYIWFVRESYSFLGEFRWKSLVLGFDHAKVMCSWDAATTEQRENWYASGEDRTIEL